VAADQAVGNGMKRPGPRQSHGCRQFTDDAARAARHLQHCAAGKRQQQYALRVRAVKDQVRHAMRERIGLAGAGTREDQQRAIAVTGRRALRRV
jgi:hypothetical protein